MPTFYAKRGWKSPSGPDYSSSKCRQTWRNSLVRHRQRDGLAPLRGLDDLHRHLLVVGERAHARLLDDGDVDEHVLAAVLGDGEAEALVGVEPLHRAVHRRGRARIGAAAIERRLRRRPPAGLRRGGSSAGRIDLEHRGDLAALLALADLDLELGLRRHHVVPGVLQHADVQERVARAVAQLDEAEALLGIEPLDGGVQRGAGRRRILSRRRPSK